MVLGFFFCIHLCLAPQASCKLDIFMERESLYSLTKKLLMNKLVKHFPLLSLGGQTDTESLHGLG